ncbi:hypothetical protein [Pontivivens ytuae]|uniref:Uncharacterized protein n=1 Tax=Pontivivens ytuae TaxID=2789856 RepID=A0A7S9LQI0_9RHOB|nr:hypothetical protein [Pontivivens ytuae]QPH53447.1 hypothetical protein I0K15_16910 [Pontivivens ytuae]
MSERDATYEDVLFDIDRAQTSPLSSSAEAKARSARLRRDAEMLRERAQAALARAQERTIR